MPTPSRIFVSRLFPGDVSDLLGSDYEIDMHADTVPPAADDFARRLAQADAAVIYGDAIDADLIAASPRLRVIADQWGAGAVDRDAAAARGVVLTTGGYDHDWIVPSEAEHAIALLLAVTRRIPEADRFVKAGRWVQQEQSVRDLLGVGLAGKTLGIVNGSARTGLELVARLQGWGMELLHHDSVPNDEMAALGARPTGLDDLLKRSDFVIVLHGDWSRSDYQIDEPQLAMMKPGAYLVNVTRGSAINENALVAALRDGRLAGAGLDKLENQPALADGLAELDNVVLTPHADGALRREREHVYREMIANCIAVLSGGEPTRVVGA